MVLCPPCLKLLFKDHQWLPCHQIEWPFSILTSDPTTRPFLPAILSSLGFGDTEWLQVSCILQLLYSLLLPYMGQFCSTFVFVFFSLYALSRAVMSILLLPAILITFHYLSSLALIIHSVPDSIQAPRYLLGMFILCQTGTSNSMPQAEGIIFSSKLVFFLIVQFHKWYSHPLS